MLFKQFHLESLGHASYLAGSEDTGDALVLDPRRDVDVYLEAARVKGLRLRYSVETHQHNDYVNGSVELASRIPIEAWTGRQSQINFPARLVDDGEPDPDGGTDYRGALLVGYFHSLSFHERPALHRVSALPEP